MFTYSSNISELEEENRLLKDTVNHLKNEIDTVAAIDEWRSLSLTTQTINLRKAIETMELDHMYYEQKGSERGLARCGSCLQLLKNRLADIVND